MKDDLKTVRVRVSGRVQGVSFRDWTRREATQLGVRGWVRNEPDGTVSVLLSGAGDNVDTMLRKLHGGPPAAAVSRVRSEEADPADAPDGFYIA